MTTGSLHYLCKTLCKQCLQRFVYKIPRPADAVTPHLNIGNGEKAILTHYKKLLAVCGKQMKVFLYELKHR